MRYTPWGKPDYSRSVVRGITSYDTPSHGGLFVTAQAARRYLRKPVLESAWLKGNFDARANGYWLEEDCDASVAFFELCYTAPEMVVKFWNGKRTLADIKKINAESIDRWNAWYAYERGADELAA